MNPYSKNDLPEKTKRKLIDILAIAYLVMVIAALLNFGFGAGL